MAEYIDKDALVAEINAFKKDAYRTWKWDTFHTLNELLSFINTLEVKEVDLEKEIDDYMEKEWEGIKEEDKPFYDMIKNDLSDIAKHFFELGLKAQKG